MRLNALSDKELPKCIASQTDMVDPTCKEPMTLNAEPMREKVLRESAEPQ
jgi:hypothetical protein